MLFTHADGKAFLNGVGNTKFVFLFGEHFVTKYILIQQPLTTYFGFCFYK
jgi:hypothetical protein